MKKAIGCVALCGLLAAGAGAGAAEPAGGDAIHAKIAALNAAGFPVVDHHAHLKGGLTIDELLAHSRETGIRYGVAANCGVNFPVTDDASARAWLEEQRGKPVLRAMQAEGREWVKTFSPETIALFDYVFTDGMTFTDHRGKRTRIWIAEEVDVPGPEAFMEKYVSVIEDILEREPIDIYVNPTVLPAVLAPDYDRLWTKARQERVIQAAAGHGVAIEINARHRLPKADFIRAAKARGVKFTFGTNNAGRELGRLEYCLEMIDACGLTPADMFAPKPDGKKPVQVRGLPR